LINSESSFIANFSVAGVWSAIRLSKQNYKKDRYPPSRNRKTNSRGSGWWVITYNRQLQNLKTNKAKSNTRWRKGETLVPSLYQIFRRHSLNPHVRRHPCCPWKQRQKIFHQLVASFLRLQFHLFHYFLRFQFPLLHLPHCFLHLPFGHFLQQQFQAFHLFWGQHYYVDQQRFGLKELHPKYSLVWRQ